MNNLCLINTDNEKLNPQPDTSPKPVTSLDDQIKQDYNDATKEGKFKNVRLKDGRDQKNQRMILESILMN